MLLASSGNSIAFALALGQSPISRPLLTAPGVDFPKPALQVHHAPRSRVALHPLALPSMLSLAYCMRTSCSPDRVLKSPVTPRQHRLLDSSFTYACTDAGCLDTIVQVLSRCHRSMPFTRFSAFRPCGYFPLQALPPPLRYYGPQCHLADLVFSRSNPICCVRQHRQGSPYGHFYYLTCMPRSIPCPIQSNALVDRFPDYQWPSPMKQSVNFRIASFGA